MHTHIEKLHSIAAKDYRRIIGLMSGTSVDGLDVAVCGIQGNGMDTVITVEHFMTVPYDNDFKKEIKSVFSIKEVDLEKLCLLNPWVALQQAKMINECLKLWGIKNEDIDVIASHGQTIYHAPASLHKQKKFGNATLQIGDGDHLAVATGIITISDFRQKHIAAGGEGAPLAVYGDYLIFSKKDENRILLNMGGIANFTFLSGDLDVSKVFSTDTGPGNTIMDALVQKHFSGKYFDESAEIAKSGIINEKLLAGLMDHPFFEQPFPKTTGPELFSLAYLDAVLEKCNIIDVSVEDTMATLNRFSALTIVEAIKKVFEGDSKFVLYASGGGMHNPLLMQHIKNELPGIEIQTTDALQINPDAKEAVLFAVLANECLCGGRTGLGKPGTAIPSVSMGKISFPD
ncbi:MAG: anhydro-N-acetylmuramic acid kinase [Chitinophagaceae bacterium]|nr:anhydro-N-acetylmuramic acid kinase [Chitinophagaceae bacterium]MBP9104664.1 anhydro-N-acetylmuramic acid kinase [Chitinophagaceae bacterium]